MEHNYSAGLQLSAEYLPLASQRRTQPMRSCVVGPALSPRGLFSSHPPPVSFLPSVIFFLRTMRSSLGYLCLISNHSTLLCFSLLAKHLRPNPGLDSTLVRTQCFPKAPSNPRTANVAAVPLRGALLLLPFLPSSFLFRHPPLSSSFPPFFSPLSESSEG